MNKFLFTLSIAVLTLLLTLVSCEWESTVDNDDPPRIPKLIVPSDHPTLAVAIEQAVDGDTIVLEDGTYDDAGYSNLTFDEKQLTIRSQNGPENTIIDLGQKRAFSFDGFIDSNTVISGITFRNGGTSTLTFGGIVFLRSASPKFVDCVFEKGRADYGGAVSCNLSKAIFENCTFNTNRCDEDGGAIYASDNSQPIVRNCRFIRNQALKSGGGIYCLQASPNITGSVFTGNTASGLGGAIGIQGSSPRIEDNTFSGNSASSGGAIHLSGGSGPIIQNCTFESNSCGTSGAAIYATGTSVAVIRHSIIAFCVGGLPVGFETTSEPQFSRSDIYGNPSGNWVGGSLPNQKNSNFNFSEDPLFCNAASDDLSLREESPCLPENNAFGERVGAFTGQCATD